jgi:hypothetical protein
MLNPRIEGRFSGQTFTTNTIGRALRRAASQAEEATYQARILRRDKCVPDPPATNESHRLWARVQAAPPPLGGSMSPGSSGRRHPGTKGARSASHDRADSLLALSIARSANRDLPAPHQKTGSLFNHVTSIPYATTSDDVGELDHPTGGPIREDQKRREDSTSPCGASLPRCAVPCLGPVSK